MTALKKLKEYAAKLWEEPTIYDPGDVINRLLTMIDNLPDESPATDEGQEELWEEVGETMENNLYSVSTPRGNRMMNTDLCSEIADAIVADLKSQFIINRKPSRARN